MRVEIGRIVGISSMFLAGCSGGSPEASSSDCAAALQVAQGFSLQGISPQGITPQGITPQGITPQGITPQGITPQGLSVQGVSVQGVSAQGLTVQGLSPQGLTAQGLQPQGVTAQGFSAQGTTLSSVALRGVTTDEAARWATGEEPTLPAEQIAVLQFERGVLSGRTMAGEALSGDALVGLLLPFASSDGQTLWVALTAVTAHAAVPELPLYTLKLDDQSLCAEGAGGVFVPGAWDESGARFDSVTAGDRKIDTTFSCLSGVLAKCVVWGYQPWSVGPELHEACTRMARADYCGDGVPHTQEGTLIDLFDTRDIQTPVVDERFTFEAAWGPDGAVCVREPRYLDQDANGQPVLPACWADKPRCESFAEGVALGAELGNDSAHTRRVQSSTATCH